MKSQILKIFIKTNLVNGFIKPSQYPTIASIFFVLNLMAAYGCALITQV